MDGRRDQRLQEGRMFKVFLLLFLYTSHSVVSASIAEFYLKKNLTAIYDPTNRPVLDHNRTVRVELDVALQQLISLEEKLQVLFTNCWIRLSWTDEHLRWKPGDWSGIDATAFNKHALWVPDIQIVNYAAERPIDNEHFIATVDYNGQVKWLYQAIVKSTCNVNVQYFPYDTQNCHLEFSSWSYLTPQLDLWNATVSGDTSVFVRNGEWHLLDMPVKREEVYTNCCADPWSIVTYNIVIQRRPLYYVYNLMVPCVCLLGTAMTGFLLPPESGEKLSLGVTILLSLTVFLLLVAEITPTQSEVIPLLGQFFGISIMLQTFSTAMNVVVINVHCRGGHNIDVPPWLRVFAFVFLARVFCTYSKVRRQLKYVQDKQDTVLIHGKNSLAEEDIDSNHGLITVNEIANHDSPSKVKPRQTSSSRYHSTLASILRTVRHLDEKISNRLKEIEKHAMHETEWRIVAVLIDRLLLVLFVLVVATVLCLFLLSPPYNTMP
ncbi:neuronal acetylcholine receptor subunit alpha-10-like isoform X2 [Lineus longissimus]|uniref:neuronal acetylcholine receptor subunit alpha-10-like isoform X2 n=1 Tax=Lineus longissimus TaxID=88925 RepID=UPI002B4DA32A